MWEGALQRPRDQQLGVVSAQGLRYVWTYKREQDGSRWGLYEMSWEMLKGQGKDVVNLVKSLMQSYMQV